MVILKSGETEIPIRASNLARIYYKQEFNRDIDMDLDLVRELDSKEIKLMIMLIFQMIWAMAKAEAFCVGKSLPQFDQWKADYLDFTVTERNLSLFFQEVQQGFAVTKTYTKNTGETIAEEEDDDMLAELMLSICLKSGMSIELMNELSTQTIVNTMHVMSDTGDKKPNRRKATQEDITSFFG